MKKVLESKWDCFVAIALLAMTTWGCPEGDDDSDAACHPACAVGYVCLYGDCVPESADADGGTDDDTDADGGADADGGDADADSDTTETEDDASDESAASCSWVAGTWRITYLPAGVSYTLYLTQADCHLTGERGDANYNGDINEDDSLSLVYDTGTFREDLTGNLADPSHMSGDWSRSSGSNGTWEATLQ
jgi:hypothetical protein